MEARDPQHGTKRCGTFYMYRLGCRCDDCLRVGRATNREYARLRRERGHQPSRRTYHPIAIKHGTTQAYQQHGCRCDDCRAAYSKKQRAWYARRKAA